MIRYLGAAALLVLTLALAACSPAAGAPGSSAPSVAPGGTQVAISADKLKFEQTEVAVPANKPFTIAFQNKEAAPHNVAVFKDSSAKESISIGEVISSSTKSQDVPALAPGSYFFRCDIHTDMTGTLVSK